MRELLLNATDVVTIHSNLLGFGVMKSNLVYSAFSSIDYYENYYEKVASVFFSLTKNHAFNDGNKRTAVLFLLVELSDVDMSDDFLFDLVLDTANDKFNIAQIAKILQNLK